MGCTAGVEVDSLLDFAAQGGVRPIFIRGIPHGPAGFYCRRGPATASGPARPADGWSRRRKKGRNRSSLSTFTGCRHADGCAVFGT